MVVLELWSWDPQHLVTWGLASNCKFSGLPLETLRDGGGGLCVKEHFQAIPRQVEVLWSACKSETMHVQD